ncbi:hypothetical protein [Pedobacter borealis]|uniref:hypothetical protein n=1 Tax=Pedobacter borealis TaxID=475254 RepID=UPI00049331C0|nr:hypothetical protein [Pedobacter borealis]
MKPIHELSTKKKAKMINQLFPIEIDNFITYLKIVAEETVDDNEELARVWGKQVLAVGFWIKLAKKVSKVIDHYRNDVNPFPSLFADELCKVKLFLFTHYYLCEYIQRDDHSEKFALAVKLFFNTDQFPGEAIHC